MNLRAKQQKSQTGLTKPLRLKQIDNSSNASIEQLTSQGRKGKKGRSYYVKDSPEHERRKLIQFTMTKTAEPDDDEVITAEEVHKILSKEIEQTIEQTLEVAPEIFTTVAS